jgi:hypothetical protein
MNADGSEQTRLTTTQIGDSYPAWSPDGKRIAFDSNRTGNVEIYVMRVDGSSETRLTDNQTNDFRPRWSADGRNLFFTSDREGGNRIFMMEADGSNENQLAYFQSDDYRPNWSPDGQKIVFTSNRDGNPDIYVMNTDGSQQKQLTDNQGDNDFPAWSPDGQMIAFASNRDGNYEIYVMNADGSFQTRLTNNEADDHSPVWSLLPSQMVETVVTKQEPIPTLTAAPTVVLPTVSADNILITLHDEPLISDCPISTVSASVVWVEPGPEEGTIVLLGSVPPEYLQILGLSAPPELVLDMSPVLTTEGFKGQNPFRIGTKFYGAVTGPVRIGGQDRRNLNGAAVVAKSLDGSALSENDIIFGPNTVNCGIVTFDLNPPSLAGMP